MSLFLKNSRRCFAVIAVTSLMSAAGCNGGIAVDTWLDDGADCCEPNFCEAPPETCCEGPEPPLPPTADAISADLATIENDVFLTPSVAESKSVTNGEPGANVAIP